MSSNNSIEDVPVWIDNASVNHSLNLQQQMRLNRAHDGFLDFKIYVRLTILEIKLLIFPTVPKTMSQLKLNSASVLHTPIRRVQSRQSNSPRSISPQRGKNQPKYNSPKMF